MNLIHPFARNSCITFEPFQLMQEIIRLPTMISPISIHCVAVILFPLLNMSKSHSSLARKTSVTDIAPHIKQMTSLYRICCGTDHALISAPYIIISVIMQRTLSSPIAAIAVTASRADHSAALYLFMPITYLS